MRRGLGVWCVLLVMAGCSAPVTGVPAPSGAAATSQPGSTVIGLPDVLLPPKVALPPRPRDVSVEGRDPCAVLTPELARELGFDRTPRPNVIDILNDAPGCVVVRSDFSMSLAVIFATRVGGIDIYNRADVFDVDLVPLVVADFPALLVRPRSIATFCVVAVDVAPGETVEFQANEAGGKPTATQDQLCDAVRQVAEPALEAVIRTG